MKRNPKSALSPLSTRIMCNQRLDVRLREYGYVVLPMLDTDEVGLFQQLYDKWHKEMPERFYKSYFSANEVYREEVEDTILRVFLPKLQQHFRDFKAFGGMFVVKPPGESGNIPPHQDWSFVDETQHWSLNLWCPLIDTTGTNGNIQMLPGSHLFMDTLRGSGTPELYTHLKEEIESHLVDVPLKVGECVFFFHGIVHCSTINNLLVPRVSVGLSMVEKNAPLRYAFQSEGETQAELFATTPDFYIRYANNRSEKPQGVTSLGFSDNPFVTLNKDELEKKVAEFKVGRWWKDLKAMWAW